ncbi:MAG: MBL fold metallo-hydrolase [Acidobacteriota bacterium]|nr:MBL fold metallo-hydrolase [Acidobacteriota bacterium]
MYVQQFFVRGLSHSSYLLGGSKTCAIIDPRRDVQIYIDAAEEMGLRITHILQTHLHADFVSGHMDLAERTGATIVVPASGGSKFEHMGVAEGDSFDIDHLKV